MNDRIVTMPAVALRATCVLPGMILHFDISRNKSIKAVENAMVNDQRIFLITQLDMNCEEPGVTDLYGTGTIGTLKQRIRMPKGRVRVRLRQSQRKDRPGCDPADHGDKRCYEAGGSDRDTAAAYMDAGAGFP